MDTKKPRRFKGNKWCYGYLKTGNNWEPRHTSQVVGWMIFLNKSENAPRWTFYCSAGTSNLIKQGFVTRYMEGGSNKYTLTDKGKNYVKEYVPSEYYKHFKASRWYGENSGVARGQYDCCDNHKEEIKKIHRQAWQTKNLYDVVRQINRLHVYDPDEYLSSKYWVSRGEVYWKKIKRNSRGCSRYNSPHIMWVDSKGSHLCGVDRQGRWRYPTQAEVDAFRFDLKLLGKRTPKPNRVLTNEEIREEMFKRTTIVL
jgi:DNA-binding PadR family transcriptional regulator